jgi:putative SOS response-associated peptidase YedK
MKSIWGLFGGIQQKDKKKRQIVFRNDFIREKTAFMSQIQHFRMTARIKAW